MRFIGPPRVLLKINHVYFSSLKRLDENQIGYA